MQGPSGHGVCGQPRRRPVPLPAPAPGLLGVALVAALATQLAGAAKRGRRRHLHELLRVGRLSLDTLPGEAAQSFFNSTQVTYDCKDYPPGSEFACENRCAMDSNEKRSLCNDRGCLLVPLGVDTWACVFSCYKLDNKATMSGQTSVSGSCTEANPDDVSRKEDCQVTHHPRFANHLNLSCAPHPDRCRERQSDRGMLKLCECYTTEEDCPIDGSRTGWWDRALTIGGSCKWAVPDDRREDGGEQPRCMPTGSLLDLQECPAECKSSSLRPCKAGPEANGGKGLQPFTHYGSLENYDKIAERCHHHCMPCEAFQAGKWPEPLFCGQYGEAGDLLCGDGEKYHGSGSFDCSKCKEASEPIPM